MNHVAASFDRERGTLLVEFEDGSRYEYSGLVPGTPVGEVLAQAMKLALAEIKADPTLYRYRQICGDPTYQRPAIWPGVVVDQVTGEEGSVEVECDGKAIDMKVQPGRVRLTWAQALAIGKSLIEYARLLRADEESPLGPPNSFGVSSEVVS